MPKTPDLGIVIELEDEVKRGANEQELKRWELEQLKYLIAKNPEAQRKYQSKTWRFLFRLRRMFQKTIIWLRTRRRK